MIATSTAASGSGSCWPDPSRASSPIQHSAPSSRTPSSRRKRHTISHTFIMKLFKLNTQPKQLNKLQGFSWREAKLVLFQVALTKLNASWEDLQDYISLVYITKYHKDLSLHKERENVLWRIDWSFISTAMFWISENRKLLQQFEIIGKEQLEMQGQIVW